MRLGVAAALLLFACAAHANNGSCLFRTSGTLALAFGSLDPSTGTTVTAAATAVTLRADEAGDCRGVTMTLNADNGQNFGNGSRRLANGTDFIAYTLSLPTTYPSPGNNRWLTIGLTGTITGAAYENASTGNYSDTVILSITP